MKNKNTVIIGRFQRPTIHPVLDDFIKQQIEESENVLILVGLAQIQATKKNPMDFETRKYMLQEAYPTVTIGYLKDVREHKEWSDNLDEQIGRFARKAKTEITAITVYGGEHTVKTQYTNNHPILDLPSQSYINEKHMLDVPSDIKKTLEYRLAVCSTANKPYAKVYPTVDIAVFNNESELLMARKPEETLFRFIGGFVDPNETWKQAAIREVGEEACIEIDNLEYVDSFVIPDHRYRNEDDSITSTLFTADLKSGIPYPQDDIAELKWGNLETIDFDTIVPEHRELLRSVITHVSK